MLTMQTAALPRMLAPLGDPARPAGLPRPGPPVRAMAVATSLRCIVRRLNSPAALHERIVSSCRAHSTALPLLSSQPGACEPPPHCAAPPPRIIQLWWARAGPPQAGPPHSSRHLHATTACTPSPPGCTQLSCPRVGGTHLDEELAGAGKQDGRLGADHAHVLVGLHDLDMPGGRVGVGVRGECVCVCANVVEPVA